MQRTLYVFAIAAALFVGGAIETMVTGDLIPIRAPDGCAAYDTDHGRIIGYFGMSNGRCRLSTWRLLHPFQG